LFNTALFFLIDLRRFEPAQKPILELTSVYSLEFIRTDMDSVDVSICAKGKVESSRGILSSPKIDVQLKASRRECSEDLISFSLPKKNYNDLRMNTMVPKILVALFLPVDKDWFDFDLDKISLYGKAYWMSLKGLKESDNRTSETIYIAQSQRLTDKTIQELMISAANREDLAYAPC
jgi:hypothetical protein